MSYAALRLTHDCVISRFRFESNHIAVWFESNHIVVWFESNHIVVWFESNYIVVWFESNHIVVYITKHIHNSVINFVAICPGGCITNAICVKPKLCRCKEGYTGAKCHFKESELCPDQPCLNAGRCLHGKCKCLPNFHGSHCHLGELKLLGSALVVYIIETILNRASSVSNATNFEKEIC